MRPTIGTLRAAGSFVRLISVFSIAVIIATLPEIAGAQSSPANDDRPLTDRERTLLERIQSLEVRLAAIESKLGGSSTEGNPEVPKSQPTVVADAASPASPSTAPISWDPIVWGQSNSGFDFTVAQSNQPYWMSCYRVMADAFFGLSLMPGLFDSSVRPSYTWLTDRHAIHQGLVTSQLYRDLNLAGSLALKPAASDGTTEASASEADSSAFPTSSSPPQQHPSSTPGPQAPTGQSTATTSPDADDKTFLPEASDGKPGIFGEFNPGRGFVVGKGRYGELDLSGYMAVRYLNQMPPSQSALDHLGRPIPIEPRNDFQFHRVMLFAQGWLFDPRFQYQTFVWTVQDTNQVAVGGALTYTFSKYITLGAGWNAYPGTMSLQGSHPYWVSYDRVMADEFFRPYFSQGVFAQGIIVPRLQYRWFVGNNNSNLDVPAVKLDRQLSAGFAITWLPTTGEFGPRGAFGDYERHEKLATRFNVAYTFSPEDRQAPLSTPVSPNTTLRLADSLNVFDTGALADGVTVEKTHYKLISASAGIKYRGLWLQGEGYYRVLDHFEADGPLPVNAVRNTGFYVQASQMIVPNRFELYASTSYVLGQFGHHPHEFIGGGNYYPWNTRNLRLNVQVISVSHSPVSSTFGFYIGQITGQVVAIGFTAFY